MPLESFICRFLPAAHTSTRSPAYVIRRGTGSRQIFRLQTSCAFPGAANTPRLIFAGCQDILISACRLYCLQPEALLKEHTGAAMQGCHHSCSLLWSKDVHADIEAAVAAVLSSCPHLWATSQDPCCLNVLTPTYGQLTAPAASLTIHASLMSLRHCSCARREPWQLVAVAAVWGDPKTLGVCKDILQQLPLLLNRAHFL